VTVNGITPAALAPGAEHTCVLLPNARVNCWGDNNWGQLGNGSPRAIFAPPTAAVTGITTAIAATSGVEYSCALLQGGSVQCWGNDNFGQLGVELGAPGTEPCDPSAACAFTPVTVTGLGVTWTSSDPTVATIDGTGLATGRGPGSTTITATSGARSGSTTLTVVDAGPTRFTLVVSRQGTGVGTVTSDDGSINCGGGGACSASYDSGTTVTLRATASAGSTFSGWSGCEAVAGTSCAVTMSEARSVTATFTRQRFTLAVSRQGTGSGTVTSDDGSINCGGGGTCSASYDSGTTVTLRATASAGSTFNGWSGCDTVSGTSCTVTVNGARSVTATFTRQRFTLAVSRQGTGDGTVTSDDGSINCGGGGACSASYDSGSQVILRATPGLLSTFVGWSGGGCSGTGACSVTLGANTTVTATFRLLGLF
jgi:List-Bact-rpt repeat protein/Big-like domain-containing protein/Regulator of Chromosome Condensation (RCC1) repeat protein